MLHSISSENLIDTRDCVVKVDDSDITECPLCHKSFAPNPLFACVYRAQDSNIHVTVVYFCRDCASTFLSHYSAVCSSNVHNSVCYATSKFLFIEPIKFMETSFDKNITELSSQFVKIYNQALAAESYNLDEIAGLGYRKALEFLIKDFAIHLHADEENKIKSMPLAACINQYIDAPNIKTLATRSAWIGNDEAHYIRKQTDRDVNDMKAFIKATVYFIGMVLITEDAESIEPK